MLSEALQASGPGKSLYTHAFIRESCAVIVFPLTLTLLPSLKCKDDIMIDTVVSSPRAHCVCDVRSKSETHTMIQKAA